MRNIWNIVSKNFHLVVTFGINLMVAIINPVFPIIYRSVRKNPILLPDYGPFDLKVLKILHYITVAVYLVCIVLLFIPRVNIVRLLFDFGLLVMQFFFLVRYILFPFVSSITVDIMYSIAVASISIVVASYQIANYFISKRLIEHTEGKPQQELS